MAAAVGAQGLDLHTSRAEAAAVREAARLRIGCCSGALLLQTRESNGVPKLRIEAKTLKVAVPAQLNHKLEPM